MASRVAEAYSTTPACRDPQRVSIVSVIFLVSDCTYRKRQTLAVVRARRGDDIVALIVSKFASLNSAEIRKTELTTWVTSGQEARILLSSASDVTGMACEDGERRATTPSMTESCRQVLKLPRI